MQEKFKEVLDGKRPKEEITEAELPEYHKFVRAEADAELDRVAALRKEKKRLEDKPAPTPVEETPKPGEKSESDKKLESFRAEQVTKAKEKLFSTTKLTDQEKAAVEERFSKLDSGSMDVDTIFKDFVASLGAVKSADYVTLAQDKADRERQAEEANAGAAGSHESPGGEGGEKKFSEQTTKLAEKAGITPEAADRVAKGGMKRTYN